LTLAEDVDLAKLTGMGSIEEQVFAKSGDVVHSAEKSVIKFIDGTQKEVINGFVPLPQDLEVRPESGALIDITCAIFDVTEGEVTQIVQGSTWRERFKSQDVSIDVAGLPQCQAATLEVCQAHPSWKNIVENGTTLHGPQFFKFFVEATGLCTWSTYFGAHTVWSLKFLKYATLVKEKDKKLYKLRMCQQSDGKLVPYLPEESCFVLAPGNLKGAAKEAYDKVLKDQGFAPLIMRGPFKSKQNFPSPTLASPEQAYDAYMLGNTFRGGEKRGLGCLVTSAGFATLQSENTRRMATLIGIALGLLQSGNKVQVYCQISDVVLVNFSLKSFLPGADFLLHLEESDYHKLDTNLRLLCTTQIREDYVAVRYFKAPPPAVGSQNVQVVFDNAIKQVFERMRYHKRFCVVTPILSRLCYTQKTFVYHFRGPWDFMGILSTEDDLKQGISYDKREVQFRPFRKSEKFEDFCKDVVESNINLNVSFLMRRAYFSPVSNVVVPPIKGYTAILSTDGELQFMYQVEKNITFTAPIEGKNLVVSEEMRTSGEDPGMSSVGSAVESISVAFDD